MSSKQANFSKCAILSLELENLFFQWFGSFGQRRTCFHSGALIKQLKVLILLKRTIASRLALDTRNNSRMQLYVDIKLDAEILTAGCAVAQDQGAPNCFPSLMGVSL